MVRMVDKSNKRLRGKLQDILFCEGREEELSVGPSPIIGNVIGHNFEITSVNGGSTTPSTRATPGKQSGADDLGQAFQYYCRA